MAAIFVLAILILFSWSRALRPGNLAVQGKVMHDAPMPLLARLRMHALTGTIVLVGAACMALYWDLPWWGPLAALVSVAALVALPTRYTLSTLGIRSGWTPFRRWTEFAGVSRATGGARLQGVAGSRDMRIWLSGSRGDDEFLLLLRSMIRGGYKGQNVLLEFPPRPSSDTPGTSAASSDITRTAM